MKYSICIILTVFICNSANAQLFDEPFYSKARIITKTDTINCFLEDKYEYKGKIKYKFNKNSKKPYKINASLIEHIEMSIYQYDRVRVGYDSYLMKLITRGEISMYKHEFIVTSNSINTGSDNFGGGRYEEESLYLVKGDVTFKVVKNKLHDKLKTLMINSTDLYAEIDKLKYNDLMFEYNLKNIISKYNNRKRYN